MKQIKFLGNSSPMLYSAMQLFSHNFWIVCLMTVPTLTLYAGLVWWAWWLSMIFGALRPEGRWFESHSSCHVGTLGKSFTHSCLWRFGVTFLHNPVGSTSE